MFALLNTRHYNRCYNRKISTGRGQGNKNSQFGTCWVTHSELGNKKISKDDLDKFLSLGYTKGRKVIVV